MRRLFLIPVLLSAGLSAQNRFPPINIANSNPAGLPCVIANAIQQYQANLYICTSGTWQSVAQSAGSVTGQASGVIPLATGPSSIGSQSHLDDGVTTPGTITSAVPIVSGALGAGSVTAGTMAGQRIASRWGDGSTTGIASAASGATNQTVIADPSYPSTEKPTKTSFSAEPFHYRDLRIGQTTDFYHNVGGTLFNFNVYSLNTLNPIGQSTYCLYDKSPTLNTYSGGGCIGEGFEFNEPGYSIGNLSGFSGGAATGWTGGNLRTTVMAIRQPGIHNAHIGTLNKWAPGDFIADYVYLQGVGGTLAGGDEGWKGHAVNIIPDRGTSSAACSTGCTPGSIAIKTAANTNVGSDRYIIDQTQPVVSTGQITNIAAGLGGAQAMTVTNTVTPSVAWGSITAAINTPNNATQPTFATAMTFNVTVASGTLTTTNLMCFTGNFHEQVYPTSVTNPAGPTATVTANLRRPHAASTYVFQGGPCGQGLDVTAYDYNNGALKFLHDVVGATDANTLQVIKFNNGTGGITNLSALVYQTVGMTNATASSGTTVTAVFTNTGTTMNTPWTQTQGATLILAGSSDSALNSTCTNVAWQPSAGSNTPLSGSGTFTCTIAGLTGTHTTTTAMTATMATLAGVPLNTYNTYQIAEVLDVQNEALSPPQVDGTLSLEPNLVNFAPGDTIAHLQPAAQKYTGYHSALFGDDAWADSKPYYAYITGTGATAMVGNGTMFFSQIDNPYNMYIGSGGQLFGMPVFTHGGPYSTGFGFTPGPQNGGSFISINTTASGAQQSTNPAYNFDLYNVLGRVGANKLTINPYTSNAVATFGQYNLIASGGVTYSANNTASTPSLLFNGNLYTAGTGTTAMSMLMLAPTNATAVTNWNTGGNYFAINSLSGFAGCYLDFRASSNTVQFSMCKGADFTVANGVNIGSGQTYKVNGTQIASTNLSDGTSVLKNVTTCGTTTTCANTAQTAPRIVHGNVALTAGSAVVASITAFTATTSFDCTGTDVTAANVVKIANTSTTSITITGTGTDVIAYTCIGN